MNDRSYSFNELNDIKNRVNEQIKRRGTYRWWDPLTTPSVGQDKSAPLSLPDTDDQVPVDDELYTINNPSTGSLEVTRNALYPDHGDNPTYPSNTSASQMNVDEMKNLLIGLSKIQDIDLYYGRDEINNLAFRNPQGIEDAVIAAERSELNVPLHQSSLSPVRTDPNNGIVDYRSPDWPHGSEQVEYSYENGQYVMPSGEFDGEEADPKYGLSPANFFDDHGAEPGDGNFHPFNRHESEIVRRDRNDQGHDRNDKAIKVTEGGVPSSKYGRNPRNPEQGNPYRSRPVYGGVPGSCNVACTGLCYQTCDNECSESCTTTCFNRCGNACTASCGNVCTGCSTMCYTSCKTKCENDTGYACLNAGAKAVKITAKGGSDGEPAVNDMQVETFKCEGCAYTCQFYPNKKTDCWDAGCMGRCFTSCTTSCSTSCFGACVDNNADRSKSYKTGKGRGCSSGCTVNCVGACKGTCEGYCTQTCWHACKETCSDNCSWKCTTSCGSGCANGCTTSCYGCTSCTSYCTGAASSKSCSGCSADGGCAATCRFDCASSCVGYGCRSTCGVDSGMACDANCRMNCTGTACTALCSDACSSLCTTCVNTCGWQCGMCTSSCSTGCTQECNITCTDTCVHTCNLNCVHSCSEECGGCSNLCYSCVGMCIGTCAVKCEDGCSNCTNQCSYWCDTSCSRECMTSCHDRCINTCSGSCATHLSSETTTANRPDQDPTSKGYKYPHPQNRYEERESFKITEGIAPYKRPKREFPTYLAHVYFDMEGSRDLVVDVPDAIHWIYRQTGLAGGIYDIDETTGHVNIRTEMIEAIPDENVPNLDGGGGIFFVILYNNPSFRLRDVDINIEVPFDYECINPITRDDNGNIIIIIQRREYTVPDDLEELEHGKNK